MGVSIWMRTGTIARSKGNPEIITPGWRSRAVNILSDHFGNFPMELNESDLGKLCLLRDGSTLYTFEEDGGSQNGFFTKIIEAIKSESCVVIGTEY
jgi:hypothetical protein